MSLPASETGSGFTITDIESGGLVHPLSVTNSVTRKVLAVGQETTKAVSYTHLDVYKRQVIGSLFSAVTVFLAWIVLRERLERTQWLGIFLIFIGIVLVSI